MRRLSAADGSHATKRFLIGPTADQVAGVRRGRTETLATQPVAHIAGTPLSFAECVGQEVNGCPRRSPWRAIAVWGWVIGAAASGARPVARPRAPGPLAPDYELLTPGTLLALLLTTALECRGPLSTMWRSGSR
jgi:hypothetical protein